MRTDLLACVWVYPREQREEAYESDKAGETEEEGVQHFAMRTKGIVQLQVQRINAGLENSCKTSGEKRQHK